jgi:hypothetical protein
MTTIACDGAGATTANCGLTLDRWVNALLVRLPGATAALVRCELEAAVRDFYHRSAAWRETIGPYPIVAGQQFKWLNPVDMYADVQHVFGCHLVPPEGGRVELCRMTGGRPGERLPGKPDSYYCTEPYTLELYPIPDQNYGSILYIDVALAPIAGTERLPEIASSHHYDGILACALWRLYAIPAKPWTNLQLAVAMERECRKRITAARGDAIRGHTEQEAPMRFSRWA